MKGKQIYFTYKELLALIKTLEEWQNLLGEKGEDIYAHRLQYGLGTAWGKIEQAKNKQQTDK